MQEERQRDQYETNRVQTRQMDDYARAEQVAIARKVRMMEVAAENRKLAEMKRQN